MSRKPGVVLLSIFVLTGGVYFFQAGGVDRGPKRIAFTDAGEFQATPSPVAFFRFDGDAEGQVDPTHTGAISGNTAFVHGLEGQSLRLGPGGSSGSVSYNIDGLPNGSGQDFSVQFWVRTDAEAGRRFVVLSQKEFPDNSLQSQKAPGWVFYHSNGTWAWSLGSGSRRLTYERDNGQHMPLNDGRWHQLTMTHNSALAEVRLFFDGVNWVSYHVSDSDGFDFSNSNPLVVGWEGDGVDSRPGILPDILKGAQELQVLVDAFNAFDLGPVQPEDFLPLISEPRRVFDRKVGDAAASQGADSLAFREAMETVDWEPIREAESVLMSNPYTVHQNLNFTGIAPVSKVYSLVDGEVVIREEAAELFAERERLYPPEFEIDNLGYWDRALSPEEVGASYAEFFEPSGPEVENQLEALTAAAWNIWHGGKHWTVEEDGWDSRIAIAEMIRERKVDVVMMQETYSSGDFIAAELGYFFATTVDWDYLNQGSNISVISRFPIGDLYVQDDSPFQNVGTKVSISSTQDLYVMSNWYGMDQFPAVFEFHQHRFQESDQIPTLFGGDFNAVPHTDGGDSPASRALLEAGFTDGFRSLYPDVDQYPGASHRSGRRIDQLYYKGTGLSNTSTAVISTRQGGFPSDHYLILSTFDLDYFTRR